MRNAFLISGSEAGPTDGSSAEGGAEAEAESGGDSDENVVDAEFEKVDDEK